MNIKALENWYLINQRKLPFRETTHPYPIWVSEIMLQQTQVDTVIPYFESFIIKYPTINDLAQAKEEELMKSVEGLGYYRRFRHMHHAAQVIMNQHAGIFPNEYQAIINLPGIGKYTAGAIMSIAYQKPYSALDGNVIRVLARYSGDDRDMRLEKNRKSLDEMNQKLIELATPSVYTQAMMELGAVICRPKNPQCDACPLQEHCVAYEKNLQSKLPFLSKLNPPIHKSYITLIIEKDDMVYLRKRDEELLKGMYEYPQFEYESIDAVLNDLRDQEIDLYIHENEIVYKHVFSHQVWEMHVYHARLISGCHPTWIPKLKTEIKKIPMAIAHRKIKIF